MHTTAMTRTPCAYEVRNVLKILSPLTSLLPSVKNRETVRVRRNNAIVQASIVKEPRQNKP